MNFTNLRKANFSYNKLSVHNFIPGSLEEFDNSHNQFVGKYSFYGGGSGIMPNLKKLNFSFNYLSNITIYAPLLSYLDVSNNVLLELDLQNSSTNLVELHCSKNPTLTKLILGKASNLNFFDCLDIKLFGSDLFSSTTSIPSASTDVIVQNSTPLKLPVVIGLSVSTFIFGLGFFVVSSLLICRKFFPNKKELSQPKNEVDNSVSDDKLGEVISEQND